jgi:hypothetical protein
MKKKIVIKEEQLKKIVQVVENEAYDDMLTNYYGFQQQKVEIPRNDLTMLANFSMRFCEGKDNFPDCKHVRELVSKHQLF